LTSVELTNMKGYISNSDDMYGQPTSITFINESSEPVSIDWVNTYNDQQVLYNVLQNGESYSQQTYIGDDWKVYKEGTQDVLMSFQAAADHTYMITSTTPQPTPTPSPTPSGGGGSTPGEAGQPINWEARGMVTGIQNQ